MGSSETMPTVRLLVGGGQQFSKLSVSSEKKNIHTLEPGCLKCSASGRCGSRCGGRRCVGGAMVGVVW